MDYLVISLCFVWVSFVWDSYLSWRQRGVYKSCLKVPTELAESITQETFDKSRVYALDKSTFSLVHSLYKQVEFLVIILLGVFPLVWSVSGDIIQYFGYDSQYEVLQSLVFMWIFQVYSTVTGLPWTIYSVFVLEERHGFNKQTAGFFIKDQIKGLILQTVLVSLLVSGLVAIIKWGGDYFFVYAWLFVLIVSVVLIMTYHDLIAPCFDKYTPLPEGELREQIEALAKKLKFPLKKLQIVEGSKRSAHSNAYFYGFGSNKCIVLFDTLLEEDLRPKIKNDASKETTTTETPPTQTDDNDTTSNDTTSDNGSGKPPLAEGGATPGGKGCSIDEILAVLAHELGHWKFSHNLKNLFIAEVNFFFCFFIFGYFLKQQDMFASFGFPDSKPIIIGLLVVFELIFTPYNMIHTFLMVQLIRRFEYQADNFAQSLGKGQLLSNALVKLVKDNLGFPVADPLYSNFNHTHPTVLERIKELKKKTD